MRCLIVVILVFLHVSVVQGSSGTCNTGCTCNDDDTDGSNLTKVESLAAAVGALAPLAVGSAGLALFKLLKGPGSPSLPKGAPGSSGASAATGAPDVSSPRFQTRRGSVPSYKDSPSTYHDSRRGSTPLSLFSEDDEISFDESWRSPRPDTSSTYTNIHKPAKGDHVNRWM